MHHASFKFKISKVQDFGDFELSPMCQIYCCSHKLKAGFHEVSTGGNYLEIDLKIFSMVIHPSMIEEGLLLVTGQSMCTEYWLNV